MRFRHPETGNKVLFLSLPNKTQTELLEAYNRLLAKQEAAKKRPSKKPEPLEPPPLFAPPDGESKKEPKKAPYKKHKKGPSKKHKKPKKGRPDLPDAKKGGRVWSDKLPKFMGGRSESWMHHFDRDPRAGGRPSLKRQKFFNKIIRKALKDVPSKPPGEREAVFLMGGPGSGKTIARQTLPEGQYVEIDADSIKSSFPEYQVATNPKKSYRKAASLVHKESAYVSNAMLDEAMAQGKPFIFDRTGVSMRRMKNDIKRAKKAGYKVRVHMVDVPKSVGKSRVRKRAETTGRYVPGYIIDEAYSIVPGNFLDVHKLADEMALTDGTTGKTVWERSGEKESVHDEGYVKKFKKRHTPKPYVPPKYDPKKDPAFGKWFFPESWGFPKPKPPTKETAPKPPPSKWTKPKYPPKKEEYKHKLPPKKKEYKPTPPSEPDWSWLDDEFAKFGSYSSRLEKAIQDWDRELEESTPEFDVDRGEWIEEIDFE